MSKYNRHQSVVSRNCDSSSNENDWLSALDKNLQKDAVQPKNVDQSLFHQINNIMNGKSKYPTVDAAVEDMKERSGLTAYLSKINKVSEEEVGIKQKKVASHESAYERGFSDAKYDVEHNQVGDILASITSQTTPLDKSEWMNYAHGYAKGCNNFSVGLPEHPDGIKADSKEVVLFELNKVRSAVNDPDFRKKHKTAADQQVSTPKDLTPDVIKKFPQIKNTLENYIRDTKGNLPIPAIIEKIKSIHQRDTSDAKDWDDEKLIRLVSQMNLRAKQDNPANFQSYNNLGTRDSLSDSEIDPSNTDAFYALNPAKI